MFILSLLIVQNTTMQMVIVTMEIVDIVYTVSLSFASSWLASVA